jgi:hypothetical protein
VLWHQVSHLLLKYTKSGYETVLTAACARQGCSASDLVWLLDTAVRKMPSVHVILLQESGTRRRKSNKFPAKHK